MNYLIFYLVGCLIAYIIVAVSNDRETSGDKYHGEFVLISWIVVAGFLIWAIYNVINYLFIKRIPTLKLKDIWKRL